MHRVDVVGLEGAEAVGTLDIRLDVRMGNTVPVDEAPCVEVDQACHEGHEPGIDATIWRWCQGY